MQPQPIEPMEYASSFVDVDDLEDVEVPTTLERRIGMAAAVALGLFGLTCAVLVYLVGDELWRMFSLGVLMAEFWGGLFVSGA